MTASASHNGNNQSLSNAYVRDYYDDFLTKHPESYSQSRWFSTPEDHFDYEQTKRALLAALGDRTYTKALEIGPGDGAWTPYIAKRSTSLTLLEQSKEMKQRVETLIQEQNLSHVTTVQGSFPADAPAQTYDLVVSVRAFEYFEDKAGALARFAALLAPGGKAIIITKNPHYVALRGKPTKTLHTGRSGRAHSHGSPTPRALPSRTHIRRHSAGSRSSVFFVCYLAHYTDAPLR